MDKLSFQQNIEIDRSSHVLMGLLHYFLILFWRFERNPRIVVLLAFLANFLSYNLNSLSYFAFASTLPLSGFAFSGEN